MEGSLIQAIFSIAVLIISVVIHEVSHGYAAAMQGDPTARLAGRLTLNPIKHLDPIGSVIVPFLTYQFGIAFGWAKPVPYNPYNLRNQRWGEAIVAIAGPASNILIALVFGLIVRFGMGVASVELIQICIIVTIINIGLAVLNLMPIPPLDGSKILFALLPHRFMRYRYVLEQYSFLFVIIFIVFFAGILSGAVGSLFTLITGLS